MSKYYCTYQHIHQIVQQSAETIKNSGWDFDAIVAIGAGGFIPARILRTFIKKPIFTISVAYYVDENQTADEPTKSQWLGEVNITGKKILLVDEVDDTRKTLEFCLRELLQHQPAEVGVYVVHQKDKPKLGQYPAEIKQIFVGEKLADQWICYPWDALDINDHDRHAHDN